MSQISESSAPKKRKNSKQKGNGFENSVAKLLTKELHPLVFMRSVGSGSRLGGKNFEVMKHLFGEDATKLFVGDVVVTNERDVKRNFNFNVECKFYKEADSWSQLVAGSAKVFGWMIESEVDAAKTNKIPMLIFKYNNHPMYVALRPEIQTPIQPKLMLTSPQGNVSIYLLTEILEYPDFWSTSL